MNTRSSKLKKSFYGQVFRDEVKITFPSIQIASGTPY